MPLISVVLTLIVIGIVVTLLKWYGGKLIAEPYLTWVIYLILIATVIWFLNILGVFDYLRAIPMPTLRGR